MKLSIQIGGRSSRERSFVDLFHRDRNCLPSPKIKPHGQLNRTLDNDQLMRQMVPKLLDTECCCLWHDTLAELLIIQTLLVNIVVDGHGAVWENQLAIANDFTSVTKKRSFSGPKVHWHNFFHLSIIWHPPPTHPPPSSAPAAHSPPPPTRKHPHTHQSHTPCSLSPSFRLLLSVFQSAAEIEFHYQITPRRCLSVDGVAHTQHWSPLWTKSQGKGELVYACCAKLVGSEGTNTFQSTMTRFSTFPLAWQYDLRRADSSFYAHWSLHCPFLEE